MKNILIYTVNSFDMGCGGLMVQYELCKIIDEMGINVRMRAPDNIPNSVFNKYYNNDFPIDDNAVIIYGETIQGNPANAKNVVRWILAPLGVIVSSNYYIYYNKTDLVYYFNSELKIAQQPEKNGTIYKLLTSLFLNPMVKVYNLNQRHGICHTFRKRQMHTNICPIHPHDSFEIAYSCTQEQCISFFNKYEYFISYDPLTFLSIIAALCGCVSIIYKVEGKTKKDWYDSYGTVDYMKHKGIDSLYGIAYGLEEIEYARSTLHLVKEQWDDILKFNKEHIIKPFIDDIQDFDKNINTVQNNYYNIDSEIVLHKGFYWPKKDGSMEVSSEYAHHDSTCFMLMNIFKDIPDNLTKFVDIEQRNVLIQAGGNVGFYVKRYSELFKTVYTFEPDSLNFYCLTKNVTSQNVFKYHAFLGADNQSRSLNNTYASLGHGGSHVSSNMGDIPTIKIDDLKLEVVDLIHLDIEGYELFAIMGAIETLKKCKPIVCIEDYEPWKQRYNTSLHQVEKILFDIGYSFIGKVEGDTGRVYKII